MMTTDDQNSSEQEANYVDSPDNDNGKTQKQIDRESANQVDHAQRVAAEQNRKLDPDSKSKK